MKAPCLLANSAAITTPQFLDHFRRAWTESQRLPGLRGSLVPRRLGTPPISIPISAKKHID